MFVALYWKTLKSALPYVPAAAVMLVITPYMTGQKPLHESAERLVLRSFNHKVKVIGHQASGNLLIFFVTSDFPTSSLSRLQRLERSTAIERLERLEQAQAKIVLSFMKDSGATISSVDRMINKTSLLPARDSRHGSGLSNRRLRSQWEK